MVNLDILLAGYIKFLLLYEFTFATQTSAWETKLWNLISLVYKVSIAVSDIWIFVLINLSFILLILVINQMSSYLHVVGIKLNTIQPIIVQNSIKTWIMQYLTAILAPPSLWNNTVDTIYSFEVGATTSQAWSIWRPETDRLLLIIIAWSTSWRHYKQLCVVWSST